MESDTSSKPSRPGGLSLYANLLEPSSKTESAPGTISRAPVVFKQGNDESRPDQMAGDKQQQISSASLRFQPTKRPHPHPSKLKSKTFQQKFSTSVPIPGTDAADIPITATRPSSKTTLADWTAQADEKDAHGSYEPEKRQRGGRKRRKKNKEPSQVPQNWDGIYDPSRPNTYDDYKHSEERILELREWKDRLYAHRVVRMQNSDSDDSGDNHRFEFKNQSALPGLSFAPPTFEESDISQHRPQVVKVQNDPTGRDAYPRRKHMSEPSVQATFGNPSPTENESIAASHQPSSPPSYQEILETAETLTSAPSISRAPVRYNLPVPPPEIPASEAELKSALGLNEFEGETGSDASPRSLRPGQKGFAQRLMSRYGWSKGSGLGVSGSGILDPLLVQIEKQRKKPDSEGGGFTGPGGRGKIVGGQKKDGVSSKTQEGRFGIMSEVVILFGMVDGMNIEAELEGSGQGGLIQEIGEECTEKYGRVERVFIDRSNITQACVFVKFTSQLSALRAVNALEGRIFNGNTIVARFFDADKFESGVFQ